MDPNRANISCRGKVQLTATRAKQVAREMRRNDRGRMAPYHCKHCGHWHIGGAITERLDPRREAQERGKNKARKVVNYGNDEA